MGNSKDTGDETEGVAIQSLISSGYSVSIPFGDNDKYDLVVEDENDLHRVQCKTAWKNKEQTIRFNTHSQTTKNGQYHEESYEGEVDAFFVRYPPKEALFWVDAEEANEQKMEIRFQSSIDHPSINWAATYRFDGEIP